VFAAVNALVPSGLSAETKISGQITVIVQDASNSVVSGAQIEIDGQGKRLEAATDQKGAYSLHQAPLGSYKVSARAAGFSPAEANFDLTAAWPDQHVRLVLRVMEHLEQVEVQGGTKANFSKGLGAQVLGSHEIALLPDDPDQLRARLQLLAAASGGSSGDAPIQVDGFLTQSSIPSKSAIREIRINPDLYSAQYPNQPIFGGGLIEIDTKPALDSVHGGFGWTWNDSLLNARDPLAATRAPLSKNVWSGELSMPIIRHRLSSFTSIEKKNLNEYGVVDAETLGTDLTPQRVVENVATPQHFLSAMERLDLQVNPLNLIALRVTRQSNDVDHFGAGALTLPDASSRQQSQRTEVQLSMTSTLSQSLLNEARLGLTLDKTWLTPYSNTPAISVAGGFLSGGSGSQYSTDARKNLELSDTLSWALPKHTIRAGFQVLRFGIDQHQGAGFNGQLLFAGGIFGSDGLYLSGLDQYRNWLLNVPGVTPTVDQYTQGAAQLGLAQWQTALFVQDEWQASSKLSLSMGLRYEAQTNPTDRGSFAPRFGTAYSFGKSREWVVRLRAGVFYRRIDPAVALEDLRLGVGQQTDFLQYGSSTILNNRLPLDGSIKPGLSVQPQLTLERRIKGGTTIQTGYTELYADRLLHSVSALNPIGAALVENSLEYQSTGASRGSVALVNVNSSAIRNLTFFGGYMYMNLKTNADSPNLFPQSTAYGSSDWAMPAWQSRHRFYAGGFVRLPGKVELTFLTALTAGNSFDITTGTDNNQNGIFNDRPSIVTAGFPGAILTPYGYLDPFAVDGNLPRNVGRLPASFIIDSGISRRFGLGKAEKSRSLTVSLRATNLTNHFNISAVDGVLGSPLFLQPTSADPSRRVELGFRFSF
jgi:hypothetical protein